MRFSHLFVLLLLVVPLCRALPDHSSLSNIGEETRAIVEARVIGFSLDPNNNSIIFVEVDKVLQYLPGQGVPFRRIPLGQNMSLGFLWGSIPVNGTFPALTHQDLIRGLVGIHTNFSTHSGHLYEYAILCGGDETFSGGNCVPLYCKDYEQIVNNTCVPLSCAEDEAAANHSCTRLTCDEQEYVHEHVCVPLSCAETQIAQDHACADLVCAMDEIADNHYCQRLSCSLLESGTDHRCVTSYPHIAAIAFAIFCVFAATLFFGRRVLSSLSGGSTPKQEQERISDEFALVVLCALIILGIPFFLRNVSAPPILIGYDSYHHDDLANKILSGAIPVSGLHGQANMYDLALSGTGAAIGVRNASIVLPLVLGVMTAALFYHVIRRERVSRMMRLAITILLICSPAFTYLFTVSAPDCLLAFMLILAYAFSQRASRPGAAISLLLFFAISLYSVPMFLLCITLLLVILFAKQRGDWFFWPMLGLLLIGSALYYLFAAITVVPFGIAQEGILTNTVTDFGAIIGFGFFNLFLAFAGIFASWRQKERHTTFYLMFFGGLVLSVILDQNYTLYISFVLAYFSGIGFVHFLERKWRLPLIKNLTVLILVCGLLFSTLSYTKRITEMPPSADTIDALDWLRNQPHGAVVTDPKYSYWITSVAAKSPVFPDVVMQQGLSANASTTLFYSRDLVSTKKTLALYNASYIFIDQAMREGGVWTRDEQGLLFLLRNNETFKKLYSNNNTEIWRVLVSD